MGFRELTKVSGSLLGLCLPLVMNRGGPWRMTGWLWTA